MKKILSLALAAMMIAGFVSCGPSEEEKKKDSLEVDSTAKGMKDDAQRMADSMEKAMRDQARMDSINNKHRMDSLHDDSMKKGLKPKGK